MKRLVAIFLCIVFLLFSFIGCQKDSEKELKSVDVSNKESSNDVKADSSENKKLKGKITFASHLDKSFWKDYVDGFQEKFPGTEIEVNMYVDFKKEMTELIASDSLTDVWTVHGDFYSKEQLTQSSITIDEKEFPFEKEYLGTDIFKGTDDKVKALPVGMATSGVVYNKKIFKELNIDVPTTLTELIAAGKKIKDSGKIGIITIAKPKWTLHFYWNDVPKMIAGDAAFKEKYVNEDTPFTPESAPVKSFELLKKFLDEKIVEDDPIASDWDPARQLFRDGEVGMAYIGNWFIPQISGDQEQAQPTTLKSDDVGFFPLPYDDNTGPKNVILSPDVALAISKNAKNPELAKEWFKYLMNTRYKELVQYLGHISARKDVNNEFEFLKEFESYNPNVIESTADSKEYTSVLSEIPDFDFNEMLYDVVAGKSVDDTFKDLNEKWKKAREYIN